LALSRDFREAIQVRAERDPAFRETLLKEGVKLQDYAGTWCLYQSVDDAIWEISDRA
jgi:hypothetical protein